MSILASIRHLTHYRYDRPVTLGPQVIRLRPAPHSRTRVVSHSLRVTPSNHFVNHQQDPYGNWLARFVFPEPVRELRIEVDLVADMTVYNPFDFFVEDTATTWPFAYPEDIAPDLSIYLVTEPLGPRLNAFLATIPREPTGTIDFVVDLNARIAREVGYIIRMEPGVMTPDETLERGQGSCRDSSWLLVQVLRHLGMAARFCSGYLIQLKPDLTAVEGPQGATHDFTDLHAWAEVFLPGAGWVGLDPTSGLLTGESHIPLAATPHYRNAAPIAGVASYAEVEFDFSMSVERVAEHPRITKPFSDEAWSRLNALGARVDERLAQGDVRLTMGGEPTFVSTLDFEAGEWNGDAVGPTKRALADKLIRRLRNRFAPGGFLHHGQGKWYPGESLPRWTFSLYWRRDGEPLWQDPTLVAPEGEGTATPADGEALLKAMAAGLGVPAENVLPAFEDPGEWVLREAKLPANVTPEDSRLENPEERDRIAQVFNRGLTVPSGFVLPVQAWQGRAWRSEKWRLRRGHVFLVPGDSAVGYRLPLSALPFVPAADYPHVLPRDPFAPTEPLPLAERAAPARTHEAVSAPGGTQGNQPHATAVGAASHLDWQTDGRADAQPGDDRGPPPVSALPEPDRVPRGQPVAQSTAVPAGDAVPGQTLSPRADGPLAYELDGPVRTALSVEAREGRLCVFLPPVERLEQYLELLQEAEKAAAALNLPVHVEGYPPPFDPRLNVIRVAPDPGVIEVNVHPAASWDECVSITQGVYEEARQARLGADKFMIDGRHVGTGGGNHVVVGGSTPADSPFLRRPDLLKSLILHWNRHPSLSYLFSGMFIGPTSQAPPRRRGAPRLALRARDRHGAGPARRRGPALAGGPAVPQPPHRRHRQHPPLRDLHRQALLARRPHRAPRAGRVPRLRDAARPAHEPRPAAPAARHRRPPLGEPPRRAADALGHAPPGPFHAAPLRVGGLPGRSGRPARPRLRPGPGVVRGAVRVPLPVLRRGHGRGRHAGAAPGAGALARPGRDRRHRRHRALRRQLGGASPGPPLRRRPLALRRSLQRPHRAPPGHGRAGRAGGGGALQGVAAAPVAAPDDPRPRAADLRRLRPVVGPCGRRGHLPRRPSGGPQLRHLPRQRQRGRGAPPVALRAARPHPRGP